MFWTLKKIKAGEDKQKNTKRATEQIVLKSRTCAQERFLPDLNVTVKGTGKAAYTSGKFARQNTGYKNKTLIHKRMVQ